MQLLKDSEIRRLPTAKLARPQHVRNHVDEARIDLRQVWTLVARGKRTIGIATAICFVLAVLYLMVTPRVYLAGAQVVIDTRQQRPIVSEQVVSNFEVTPSVLASEVLTMRSNVLLGRVVEALNLTTVGEFRTGNESMSEEAKTEYAVGVLQANLSVRQAGLSHVIQVTYGSGTPEIAAMVANEVARQYIAEDIGLKREAARQATTFLQERINELARDVELSEQAVVDYQREILNEVGRDSSALAQLLAELNTELVTLSQTRSEGEIRLRNAQELLESGGVEAVREAMTSAVLDALAATYATLASEQARLAATLGTDHPRYKTQSALLEDVLRSMNEEARKLVAAMRNELEVVKNRENALEARIAQVVSQQTRLAEAAVRRGQLERAASAARLVFEEFLTRFTETNAQSELQLPQARIIGMATVPGSAAEPKVKLVLILALVIGMASGTSIVLVRAAMLREIGSIAELEQATDVPVVAALPSLSERAPNWPVGQKSFRSNRLTLYQDRIKAVRGWIQIGTTVPENAVMVTSTLPGEGKSTMAIALAHSLRQIGCSVLMVDTDLRNCLSAEDFNLTDPDACLVDYLMSSQRPGEHLIQHSPDFDVSIVAPMRPYTAESDLLATPAFARMMRWAAERFDFVIVDAPSAVDLAASQTVASTCGSAVLLVRSHQVRASLVHAAVVQLQDAGIERVGTVLSHVLKKEGRSDELQNYQSG